MARDPKKLKAARDRYAAKKKAERDGTDKVASAKAKGDAATEREKLIVRRYKSWEKLVEHVATVRKDFSEKLAAAQANLRAAVEEGITAGDTSKALAKLRVVERAWQKLDEVKAERAEALKEAKGDMEAAHARLKELVENSAQLSLFEATEEPSDRQSEDDADDE